MIFLTFCPGNLSAPFPWHCGISRAFLLCFSSSSPPLILPSFAGSEPGQQWHTAGWACWILRWDRHSGRDRKLGLSSRWGLGGQPGGNKYVYQKRREGANMGFGSSPAGSWEQEDVCWLKYLRGVEWHWLPPEALADPRDPRAPLPAARPTSELIQEDSIQASGRCCNVRNTHGLSTALVLLFTLCFPLPSI